MTRQRDGAGTAAAAVQDRGESEGDELDGGVDGDTAGKDDCLGIDLGAGVQEGLLIKEDEKGEEGVDKKDEGYNFGVCHYREQVEA